MHGKVEIFHAEEAHFANAGCRPELGHVPWMRTIPHPHSTCLLQALTLEGTARYDMDRKQKMDWNLNRTDTEEVTEPIPCIIL